MKALGEVRVLDLTRALAGPYCSMMLGDYGADIIKIELPGTGDDTRHWGPPYIGEESAYFLSVNRNKRSMTLNLKHPQGKDIFFDLAKRSDVILENFTPGVVSRLGIDYATVRGVNPSIVYCSISGFGQTGPYKGKSAYDQVMQGISGVMSLTGDPDGHPIKVGIALTDIGAGMLAAFAIVTALHHSNLKGSGQYIDISMLDLQASWLTYQAGYYFATGSPPNRVGTAHPTLAPYQTFTDQDGKTFIVAIGSERLWTNFCKAMKREDLANAPEYATNSQRVKNRFSLERTLQTEFDKKPVSFWIQTLEHEGIPCGPINSVVDVFNDPQVNARDMVIEIQHPTLGAIKQTGIPIKFSDTKGSIDRHPPLLGEHTSEILMDLGFSAAKIKTLKKEQVI